MILPSLLFFLLFLVVLRIVAAIVREVFPILK